MLCLVSQICRAVPCRAVTINIAHLPARAKEAGWSDDRSGMLLSVYAIISMVTRSGHGWFVDSKYISYSKLHTIALFAAALVNLLNPVSNSYIFLEGYAVLFGACIGVASPLFAVNMRSLVGTLEVSTAMSLLWATICISNGMGSVIAGK